MRNARDIREQRETRPEGRAEASRGTMPPATQIPVARAHGAGAGQGAIGGILGGAAMGLFAMIVAALMGMGFWAPLKMISATFYGEAAMAQPGFAAGPVLVGLMIHMVVSAVYGAIYGTLARPRWSGGALLGWGVVYGLVIWALAYLLLPLVNPLMSKAMREGMQPFLFAAEHVIYGAALGGYLGGYLAARRG